MKRVLLVALVLLSLNTLYAQDDNPHDGDPPPLIIPLAPSATSPDFEPLTPYAPDEDYQGITVPLVNVPAADPPAEWVSFEDEVVRLTNLFRQQIGVDCLAPNNALQAAARLHSEDMFIRDYLAHTNPDGVGPQERAATQGYTGGVGENISRGRGNPAEVMAGWRSSRGHYFNLIGNTYDDIGIGYYKGPGDFDHLWTMKLGNRTDAGTVTCTDPAPPPITHDAVTISVDASSSQPTFTWTHDTTEAGNRTIATQYGIEVIRDGRTYMKARDNLLNVSDICTGTVCSATPSTYIDPTNGQSIPGLPLGANYTLYVMSFSEGGGHVWNTTEVVNFNIETATIPPTVSPISDQLTGEGEDVTLNISANDPDGRTPLTYSATNLPGGLSINSTTGQISGTVSEGAGASSPYDVNITVTDADSQTTSINLAWFISSTGDCNLSVPNNNVTVLIRAIELADSLEDLKTICLAENGTYTLTSRHNDELEGNGLPVVRTNLTINGRGATIERGNADGVPTFRFLYLPSGGALTLQNLTFRNGDAGTSFAGGFYSWGALTLENVTISNSEGRAGGAIRASAGSVTITDSTFSGNIGREGGGALYISGATANITSSTFVNNSTSEWGGAITLWDTGLTVTNSTFSGNQAAIAGGAIAVNQGDATLSFNTFVGNTNGESWSGTLNNYDDGGGTTTLKANIFSAAGNDCNGSNITSNGYNISNDESCNLTQASDQNNTDAQLGTLADNGGRTQTVLPQTSSPAINAIPAGDCDVAVGQRGATRPQEGNCEIGAVEILADGGTITPEPTVETPSPVPTTETPTPEPTPTETETSVEGAYPTEGQTISNAAEYQPRFRWAAVEGAAWYHVYVSTPDYETFVFSQWYDASTICESGMCTATDDIWLPQTGEFYFWLGYWNESLGDDYVDTYRQTTFALSMSTPPNSLSGAAPSGEISGSGVSLQWTADPNVLWYQIWLGTADYERTTLSDWYPASDICTGETCTLPISSTLRAGSYEWWAEAWGPGGYTEWFKASDFTVTP